MCKGKLQISALPYKEGLNLTEVEKRVMFCDPSELYNNCSHNFNHFDRVQSNRLSISRMFPQQDPKLCACGCGKELTGRQKRWASKECSDFAVSIYWIFYGQLPKIQKYIWRYYGMGCVRCGDSSFDTVIHMDHIIPVAHGGGGCWLNNFQPICSECHKEKTKEDFGWEETVDEMQLQLNL